MTLLSRACVSPYSISLKLCLYVVPFMSYSGSKNRVTLKLGVGRSRSLKMASIDRSYDFLLVGHCKYSCMLYRFQVIWRWIIVTLKKSLKFIQTGAIWRLGCSFLFAFYSNYGCMLHQFRDKHRYWSKIVIFSYPLAFDAPVRGPRRNIAIPFGTEN